MIKRKFKKCKLVAKTICYSFAVADIHNGTEVTIAKIARSKIVDLHIERRCFNILNHEILFGVEFIDENDIQKQFSNKIVGFQFDITKRHYDMLEKDLEKAKLIAAEYDRVNRGHLHHNFRRDFSLIMDDISIKEASTTHHFEVDDKMKIATAIFNLNVSVSSTKKSPWRDLFVFD